MPDRKGFIMHIFVTVGSQKFQFDRLLRSLDDLVEQNRITDSIFAQSGYCTYAVRNYPCKAFLDRNQFSSQMEKADIILTHGGTGVIIEALKKHKKVIAVPRLARYGEHVDDHQIQLLDQLSESGLICEWQDCDTLDQAIEIVKHTEYKSFKSNTNALIDSIDSFIQQI
jgi:UDP-N-acetylglucosamine transferase subunit ALG13